MIKLFATLKEGYLKLRPAHSGETQISPFIWKEELSIEFTANSDFMMYWTSLLPDLEPPEARALVELVAARYPLSDSYKELKNICTEIIFNDSQEEWVFYGGSFQPWHQGHQNCLNLLPQDKTCIIIPDINPQKDKVEFELVSRILEISSKCRLRDHQYLCPTFLSQNRKNPSINWIEKIQELVPNKKISLLMGFDSIYSIHTWVRSEELLKKIFAIYIASRMESDEMQKEISEKILKINPNLKIIFLGRHDEEQLSSSKLRLLK